MRSSPVLPTEGQGADARGAPPSINCYLLGRALGPSGTELHAQFPPLFKVHIMATSRSWMGCKRTLPWNFRRDSRALTP